MTGIIYKAKNSINGKEYVGQTIQTLSNRIREGYGDTKFGLAIKKYGKQNFIYTILWELEADTKQELIHNFNIIEEIEIGVRNLTDRDSGYNTKMGGFNGTFRHTSEAIEKIRQSSRRPNKGRFQKGLIPWIKGKNYVQTEQQKLNTSVALKKAYVEGRRKSWNAGKKATKEHRMKISKALSGRNVGQYPTHVRWHIARNIVNNNCGFCIGVSQCVIFWL